MRHLALLLIRNRIWGAAAIASLLAALYWGIIASDGFVSEAHVIIQRTELASGNSVDFASLLGNAEPTNRADQLLLREYLVSMDMLKKLDEKLNLRTHYSDSKHDLLSRLWLSDTALEPFHRYFRSRVDVVYDDYTGVLVIKAQAYDPGTAHAIARMLVEEGERFMNAMLNGLARDQLVFLEAQAAEMNKRLLSARQAVLNYQNQKGLVSPQNAAENAIAITNRLTAQLAELQTNRLALQAYLVAKNPKIVELDQQIAAIEQRIAQETTRLASKGGKTLNLTVEEYQRLELTAAFAQDVYKTALVALETGRIDATRKLKKVSVVQAPSVPQHPVEPRRLYNTVVFALVALLLAGVAQLLVAIVRDHMD